LCAAIFCQPCLSFHQQEQAKAAHSDSQATPNKKSA
jgi:hypothetical protein